MRPIRITHVINSLERAGAQRMLAKLVTRMDNERFACRVVSLMSGGDLAPELEQAGVQVESLGLGRGLPTPMALVRLVRILRRWSPDVLQTWLYHSDLLGCLAGALARRPTLCWNIRCTAHDAPEQSLVARWSPRLCAMLSRAPAAVITNSTPGRLSHEAVGYHPKRWVKIPNGFDLQRFQPSADARARLRQELGLDEGHVLAAIVARWHPVKNHDGLLEALGRVRSAHPELRLILIGAGTEPGNPTATAAIRRHDVEDVVIGLGERTDLPALIAGLDFLVSASHFEGFPNVIGEALACGVPCLATDVGECAEVLGSAGRIVPASTHGLAEGLSAMIRLGTEERRRLGACGRARVEAEFSLESVVERYQELYRELASKSRKDAVPGDAHSRAQHAEETPS